MGKKIRVLIGKVGLDGHDVGAKVVAKALADAGMEVIYTGLRQTPTMLVSTALQEGVDLIGISILSGSHLFMSGEIIRILKEKHLTIPLIVGGIIPSDDIPLLKEMGVAEVFLPETAISEIVNSINKIVQS
jgi:methylmalonyl-CoA mutase C-terminal domain/subunit